MRQPGFLSRRSQPTARACWNRSKPRRSRSGTTRRDC
jgi:hypothetical protein